MCIILDCKKVELLDSLDSTWLNIFQLTVWLCDTLQDKVSTDQFIIDYAEAVGPVASELFGKLSKAVEVALEKAKIAKIYVVELLLTKSIVNYRSCYKLGDETGVIEARGVIKQQMDLFAGDGSGNQLGLRASDIFEPLLNAEKHTHGWCWDISTSDAWIAKVVTLGNPEVSLFAVGSFPWTVRASFLQFKIYLTLDTRAATTSALPDSLSFVTKGLVTGIQRMPHFHEQWHIGFQFQV